MLAYAVKLTTEPHRMDEADVEALRTHGFDDRAILDVCQVVSYYNYVNRLADGLGIELEPEWEGRTLTLSRAELEERRAKRRDASIAERSGTGQASPSAGPRPRDG